MATTTPTCQSTDLNEAISRLDAQIRILEKQWGNNQTAKEYATLNELTEAREIIRRNLAAKEGRRTLGQASRILDLSYNTIVSYILNYKCLPTHVDENGDYYLTDDEIHEYQATHHRRPRKGVTNG